MNRNDIHSYIRALIDSSQEFTITSLYDEVKKKFGNVPATYVINVVEELLESGELSFDSGRYFKSKLLLE